MVSSIESAVVVTLVTALTVGIVIAFHYQVIRRLSRWVPSRPGELPDELRGKPTILLGVFVLLFAHVAEIWLFGAAFWWLLEQENYGAIVGYLSVDFLDCVYFSAAAYSTVGWGDLTPSGDVRFLAGTEALVGFMMITWSASFSFLNMSRVWGGGDE